MANPNLNLDECYLDLVDLSITATPKNVLVTQYQLYFRLVHYLLPVLASHPAFGGDGEVTLEQRDKILGVIAEYERT